MATLKIGRARVSQRLTTAAPFEETMSRLNPPPLRRLFPTLEGWIRMREAQNPGRRRVYLAAAAGIPLPRPVTFLQFVACYVIGVAGGFGVAMAVWAQFDAPAGLSLLLSIPVGVLGGFVLDRLVVMGVLGGLTMQQLQSHPMREVHAYRPLGALVVDTTGPR